MKAIKSDSDSDEQKKSSVFEKKINRGDTAELATKKVVRFFRKKNRGVTPSVAVPNVTHPSDAAGQSITWTCAEIAKSILLQNTRVY